MFKSVFAVCALFVLGNSTIANAQDDAKNAETFEQRMENFLAKPDVARKKFSADKGDPYAMVWLADELSQQVRTSYIDDRQILPMQLKLYMDAVAQNYPAAFNRMGKLVLDGRLPEGTPMAALDFFRKGAALGDVDSALGFARVAIDPFVCSICSKSERGVLMLETAPAPDTTGMGLVEMVEAMGTVKLPAGKKYLEEKRGLVDEGVAMLESELMSRNEVAQREVAFAYLLGIQSAALNEYGTYSNGQVNILQANPEKARPIYESYAVKGKKWALKRLRNLYFVGSIPGFERDREKFISYSRQLADNGDAEAAYILGHELVSGQNFASDYDVGATYLNIAHQKGYGKATLDLAYMFLEGRGFPKDEKAALTMFEKAADNGSSGGAQFLADWWREGGGGVRNPLRAKLWQDKADTLKKNEDQGERIMSQLNDLGR